MDPKTEGVYDSFRVLRNSIASGTAIAANLLLCDEMLKARQMVCLAFSHGNSRVELTMISGQIGWTWAGYGRIGSLASYYKLPYFAQGIPWRLARGPCAYDVNLSSEVIYNTTVRALQDLISQTVDWQLHVLSISIP